MELILIKPVRKLGNIGDVVSVAMGYGRNFLMPKGLAIRATEINKKSILERTKILSEESANLKNIAEENIKYYVNKYFTFIRNSSYEGRLYGSLSIKEISEALTTDICVIRPDNVYLNGSIKKIGIFNVIISLYPGVECTIFINVAKNEADALAAISSLDKDN